MCIDESERANERILQLSVIKRRTTVLESFEFEFESEGKVGREMWWNERSRLGDFQ